MYKQILKINKDQVSKNLVILIGASTAFFAATIALVQNDIKKIIAYSTCSQLGYMFFAAGGIEYTYYGIRNTQSDLGVIVEYAFDDRNDNPFNNEGVIGLRWSLNDIKSSSLLAGYLFDMRGNSNRFQAEFEQRVNDDLKLFFDHGILDWV